MNTTDFIQTGGFPLKLERLNELQQDYQILQVFGELAGNYTILKGCEQVGNIIKEGYLYINGEVVKFNQSYLPVAPATPAIVITETEISREFENGELKAIRKLRTATFGTSVNSILWSAFKRVTAIKDLQSRILPPGTNPQLFSGSINAIPTGWQLCDGTNGTPDLTGRFIVGYDPNDTDYNTIGNTGGAKTVSLTAAQNGQHTHTATANSSGAHTHGIDLNINSAGDGIPALERGNSVQNQNYTTKQAGEHSHSITVQPSGEGAPHENRPPYYTLAYIIYTG
ncbi:hypothetical protein GCM10007424_23900 [Flavobacterium suaedae]|uniref:Baseplate structural protein Gp10 C-terminal domain-containing protein n=1 Tax=Flavobacterium suaedae TaxID=1767027 RepID=A0ABQ1K3C6_9FLAO|nr:hypothetical protein [Flavobacterium suaedae]GGB83101.1 hypothetical protein GCM10007424_23900 [Flavobacterium suaedae]